VERRVGQGDDAHARRVRRGMSAASRRAALGLVAPAVGHGPDAVDAERGRDVARHGVGVDEQDVCALAGLQREARFVATVVLPTPPFGLKTAIVVARPSQPAPKSPPGGPARCRRRRSRAGCTSPRRASGSSRPIGRVKYSLSSRSPLVGQALERLRRDDRRGRDRPAGVRRQRRRRAPRRDRPPPSRMAARRPARLEGSSSGAGRRPP
jgi:hypothetical protein